MKANEFVKKHGIDKSKFIASKYFNYSHVTDDARMLIDEKNCKYEIKIQLHELLRIDEIKRLIESYELVEIHGFENSKEIVANAPSDDHFYSWTLGNSGVRDKTVNIGELRKAIADVESCQ